MFKYFLLHDHLYIAPKPRKTSQGSIETDSPEGNHVLQNWSAKIIWKKFGMLFALFPISNEVLRVNL